ncbi:MAG: hypothetical protein PWP58_547 [Bacillota bacterium]|nr:hypothetical protein [Bacillota bacterium]
MFFSGFRARKCWRWGGRLCAVQSFGARQEFCRRCPIMQKSPEFDDNLPADKTRTRRGRDSFRPEQMQGQGSARREEESLIYAPQMGFPAYLRGIETLD